MSIEITLDGKPMAFEGPALGGDGPGRPVTERELEIALYAAAPCSQCRHQFRHHAVTAEGYRCRGCKCKRRFWR